MKELTQQEIIDAVSRLRLPPTRDGYYYVHVPPESEEKLRAALAEQSFRDALYPQQTDDDAG